MTAYQIVIGLALGFSLYFAALGLARLRRLSAQMAVLTLRVTELVETVDALETELRS